MYIRGIFPNDLCAKTRLGFENMAILKTQSVALDNALRSRQRFPRVVKISFAGCSTRDSRLSQVASKMTVKADISWSEKVQRQFFPAELFAWFLIGGADGIHC